MRALGVGLASVLFGLLANAGAAAETPFEPLVIVQPHAQVVRTTDARRLVADVNSVRLHHGLAHVAVDDVLSRAALAHARDMAARRYFGHFSPDGGSLPDRLAAVGFRWSVAAENIALDEDERHAHAALLESAPHRANILDPRVRKIGVAALDVGVGAALYVEEFAL